MQLEEKKNNDNDKSNGTTTNVSDVRSNVPNNVSTTKPNVSNGSNVPSTTKPNISNEPTYDVSNNNSNTNVATSNNVQSNANVNRIETTTPVITTTAPTVPYVSKQTERIVPRLTYNKNPEVDRNVNRNENVNRNDKIDYTENEIEEDDDDNDDDDNNNDNENENENENEKSPQEIAVLSEAKLLTDMMIKANEHVYPNSYDYLATVREVYKLLHRIEKPNGDTSENYYMTLISTWETLKPNEKHDIFESSSFNKLTKKWINDGLNKNPREIDSLTKLLCRRIMYCYIKYITVTKVENKRHVYLMELVFRFYQLYILSTLHKNLSQTFQQRSDAIERVRQTLSYIVHAIMISLNEYKFHLPGMINAAILMNRSNDNVLAWIKGNVLSTENEYTNRCLQVGKNLIRTNLLKDAPKILRGELKRGDDQILIHANIPLKLDGETVKKQSHDMWFTIWSYGDTEKTMVIFQVNAVKTPLPHVRLYGTAYSYTWWEQGKMYALATAVDPSSNAQTTFQKLVTYRSIVESEATDNVHICQNFNLKLPSVTLHGILTHQLFADRFSYCEYTRNVYSFIDASNNFMKRPPLFIVRIECETNRIKNSGGEIVTLYNVHQWKNFKGTQDMKNMTAMILTSTHETVDYYNEIVKYTEYNDEIANVMFKLPIDKTPRTYTVRSKDNERECINLEMESDSDANEVALRIDKKGNVQIMIRHRVDRSKRVNLVLTTNNDQIGQTLEPLSKVSINPPAASRLKLNYGLGNYEKSVRKCCDIMKQL